MTENTHLPPRMTGAQFGLITARHFSRINASTIAACWDVILGDSVTAYAAETAHGCKRGTVSRYVNQIYAEYSYCLEVTARG